MRPNSYFSMQVTSIKFFLSVLLVVFGFNPNLLADEHDWQCFNGKVQKRFQPFSLKAGESLEFEINFEDSSCQLFDNLGHNFSHWMSLGLVYSEDQRTKDWLKFSGLKFEILELELDRDLINRDEVEAACQGKSGFVLYGSLLPTHLRVRFTNTTSDDYSFENYFTVNMADTVGCEMDSTWWIKSEEEKQGKGGKEKRGNKL